MAVVDSSIRKLGADLLNTQLWCWGADITSPYGNLLVKFGCRREPPRPGMSAPSLYRWETSGTHRIVLRGFGAFVGDDRLGGMFLRRDGFQPRLTPSADLPKPLWHATDLPKLSRPRPAEIASTTLLTVAFIDWTLQYECWVQEVISADWRERSLRLWLDKHPRCRNHAELSCAWREFREGVIENPDGVLLERRGRR